MVRNIERKDNEIMDMRLTSENCNCSVFTMGALACGLLFCLGIIVYALLVC